MLALLARLIPRSATLLHGICMHLKQHPFAQLQQVVGPMPQPAGGSSAVLLMVDRLDKTATITPRRKLLLHIDVHTLLLIKSISVGAQSSCASRGPPISARQDPPLGRMRHGCRQALGA